MEEKDNLDITKIRLSIADLAHDIETIIRLNPKFLLSTDSTKEDIIKALKEQIEKTNHYINLHINDDSSDQYLLLLVIRLLELRRIIKEEIWHKS